MNIDEICKKIQITKPTLLKWINETNIIETIEIDNQINTINLISIHTYLQHIYSQTAKYSKDYLINQIENNNL